MKKLSTLLGTSLIASGLLFTASTSAMTYTVNGDSTSIAIPTWINGTTIKWCQEECETTQIMNEWNGCGDNKCCERPINNHSYIECRHTYSTAGTYTVYFDGKNNEFDNLYLDAANIQTISNYSDIRQITNLYLWSNTNLVLWTNSFSSSPVMNVYLDHNNISTYNTNIPNNFNIVSLESNRLTTIPDIIRNLRNKYRIKLSSSKSYNPNNVSDKYIDLSDNLINFIEIISAPSSATTSYSIQWFGYTYDDSILDDWKITYNYKIFTQNNERISDSFQEDNWTNVSKNITLPSLEPWTYTFKVCINGTENICDEKDFTVSYSANIKFTNKPNSTLSSINNISFSRIKIWTYPDEFIQWYKYTLKKGSSTLYSQDSIVNSTSYTPNTNLFSSDPNWDYTFTVTLLDTNWVQIDSEWATFNITIDDNIIISSPSWQYTDNWVYTKNIDLNWTTASSLFSYYDYYVTKNSGCSPSNIITSWNNITEKSPSFSYSFQPWTYLLCITLHNSNGSENTNNSSFSIDIPSTLTIESPSVWLQSSNNINFRWIWFSPFFDHYEYTLNRTDEWTTLIKSWTWNTTWFQINWLHHWEYEFTVAIKSSDSEVARDSRTFQLLDDVALTNSITSNSSEISEWWTIASRTATFTWSWKSEDFAWYSYSITWTTFSWLSYSYTWTQLWQNQWSFTLSNLQTWKYKFTITMIDSDWNAITSNEKNFNVVIPATLTITSPSEWATITSSSTTFSWTGYSDIIEKYWYALTYWDQPVDTNNFTNSTKITSPTLKNWNYTLTVWIISWVNVAQDTIHFTVAIPVKTSWWSSSKTHYSNNLKLSIWNDSPSINERIKLIVKIDDSYVWKVSFPKLQYYNPDTEKWTDIPVTSKNYVSDYSDDAKLGYIKFSSSDDWRKDLEQFIKFSKNWYYRIYAEDKDWYDEYVEIYVGSKKATATNSNYTGTNTPTTNSNSIDSIIRNYIPEVFEQQDTSEEVYIARSCKKYTIRYSDSLNVYTSPNLNMSEYFVNKDYFKRYIDSKNKYQSWCPTNIGWISTNYSDKSNDDTRYTAPNGKVYFITWQRWNHYSDELNKELKTPTSFNTIQELKYYIRDRNPLISMAALWPTN